MMMIKTNINCLKCGYKIKDRKSQYQSYCDDCSKEMKGGKEQMTTKKKTSSKKPADKKKETLTEEQKKYNETAEKAEKNVKKEKAEKVPKVSVLTERKEVAEKIITYTIDELKISKEDLSKYLSMAYQISRKQ